jgi:hypothetical protein
VASTQIAIQTLEADRATLQEIASELGLEDLPIIQSRPFDGQDMLNIVVPVTAGVVRVLTIWIRAHYGRVAQLRFSYEGIDIRGHDSEAVERMLTQLQEKSS